jgi:hypothetical protein
MESVVFAVIGLALPSLIQRLSAAVVAVPGDRGHRHAIGRTDRRGSFPCGIPGLAG